MQRILVVEDDPLVSETILCILEEHYQVTLASSAHCAAACLRDEAFDVVLLDCILPGGGVADLIAQAECGGATVVLTSGDPEQIEAQGGGRRLFLAKPFSLNRLLEVVAAVSAERVSSRPHPAPLPQLPTHTGPTVVPLPTASGSSSAREKAWPAVLTGTAWAAAIHVTAATLRALTCAPAVIAAAPHRG